MSGETIANLGAFPGLTGLGAARLRDGPWRVAVVGAGGWLGLATLELLHRLLGDGFADRVVCFGSSARTLILRGGVAVEQESLARLSRLSAAPTLVLHLAFLTQEKAKAMSEADYVSANRAISGAMFAVLDEIGAEGLFVPSSGAVGLAGEADAEASKRLYGRLKLDEEGAATAWAMRTGHPAAIARVFNLAGPYINKQSSYALACFIADALAHRPIEIRATRPALRSYVAISELMSVAFGVLTDRSAGPVLFDTAGERAIEMADIARAVSQGIGGAHPVSRAPMTGAVADSYVGDGRLYRALRERYEVVPVDFETQVSETVAFMAQGAVSSTIDQGVQEFRKRR